MQARLIAKMFNAVHGAVFAVPLQNLFRAQPDMSGRTGRAAKDICGQNVDARLSKTAGGVNADGVFVQFTRCAKLHQLAVVQKRRRGSPLSWLQFGHGSHTEASHRICLNAFQLDPQV